MVVPLNGFVLGSEQNEKTRVAWRLGFVVLLCERPRWSVQTLIIRLFGVLIAESIGVGAEYACLYGRQKSASTSTVRGCFSPNPENWANRTRRAALVRRRSPTMHTFIRITRPPWGYLCPEADKRNSGLRRQPDNDRQESHRPRQRSCRKLEPKAFAPPRVPRSPMPAA